MLIKLTVDLLKTRVQQGDGTAQTRFADKHGPLCSYTRFHTDILETPSSLCKQLVIL